MKDVDRAPTHEDSSEDPRHCPYYCEENIWQLCGDPRAAGEEQRVALVSNPQRQVALWFQRAADEVGLPVIWDYHVVLFVLRGGRWWASDLDCVLGAPLAAERWLQATFAGTAELPASFAPRFRWIAADTYRERLATDRRHMRADDGGWLALPPDWPTIGVGSNLMDWVDLERTGPGEVLDLATLRQRIDIGLAEPGAEMLAPGTESLPEAR